MMMSSCPRDASPSFAVSALGETRIVSSWTSVPRTASARAIDVEKRERQTANKKIASSRNGNADFGGVSPSPPRFFEIMRLGRISEKILELQWVAGKILRSKNLEARSIAFIISFAVALSG